MTALSSVESRIYFACLPVKIHDNECSNITQICIFLTLHSSSRSSLVTWASRPAYYTAVIMTAHEPTPEYLAEYSGGTLIAISVLFIVLDTILVALRFYARHLIRSPICLDDFIVPFGWLTHVGVCILGISQYSVSK
jgi:hypothetical protein